MHLRNGGLDDVFPDPARRTDYVESQCGAGGALVSLGLDLALDGISTRRQGEFLAQKPFDKDTEAHEEPTVKRFASACLREK